MASISAEVGLTMRIGVGHKKGFGSHDGITPHHQITITRNVSDDLTEDELVEKAAALHKKARTFIEKKMTEDKEDLQKVD